MNTITPQSILDWLGPARAGQVRKQVGETPFNQALQAVAAKVPNAPTGGIWLLQMCGSKPKPEDLSRWSEDVRKLKEPVVKKPAKKASI